MWAEIWPDTGPRIDQVMTTREETWDQALLLFLERHGSRKDVLGDDPGPVSYTHLTLPTKRIV